MADEQKNHGPKKNLNPESTPILYTDMIDIGVNEDGVTLNVCQKIHAPNHYHIVARVGMSRTQAKKLASELSKILALTSASSQTGEKKN